MIKQYLRMLKVEIVYLNFSTVHSRKKIKFSEFLLDNKNTTYLSS